MQQLEWKSYKDLETSLQEGNRDVYEFTFDYREDVIVSRRRDKKKMESVKTKHTFGLLSACLRPSKDKIAIYPSLSPLRKRIVEITICRAILQLQGIVFHLALHECRPIKVSVPEPGPTPTVSSSPKSLLKDNDVTLEGTVPR